MSKQVYRAFAGLLLLLLAACGPSALTGAPSAGGNAGATPGGVQDMGFARELIANGKVPPAEAFVVEGMFSEHDLPLAGEPCAQLLCLNGALGVAPTLAGKASAWLQVGMASNLDLKSYPRPPLNLVITVDISGSMDWQYTTPYNEYQTPLGVSKALMRAIIPTLRPEDKVAIVSYGSSAQEVLPLTSGSEQERLLDAVDALHSEGSTNMEAGLETAFRTMQSALPEASRRVILFTDVQPNVGATEATQFQQLVGSAAEEDIGLSVFGVGVGLGPEVFDAMSKLRGGNAFTLFGTRDVARIMNNDWPFLTTPLAYNLEVKLAPQGDLEVAEGYGFPTADKEANLTASTVFLSKRRGALLVRLEPTTSTALQNLAVNGSLAYDLLTGEHVEDTLASTFAPKPNDQAQAFAQPSVGKTVALALLVSGMKDAAATYSSQPQRGAKMMQGVYNRFAADAKMLQDSALAPEVTLAKELLALMEEGAPQGTLYGDGTGGY